ncbi:MAG: hypothetical protein ACRERD_04280 [Candidatus Binatia bacterium]
MRTHSPLAYHTARLNDLENDQFFLASVLPEQFYGNPVEAYTGSPEAALMRAVLEDAFNCFHKQFVTSGRNAQRLAREAEEWFFTNDDQWPFSFVQICTVLGLDPEYIRLGLKRWRQQSPTTVRKKKRHVVSPRRSLRIAA